MTKERANMAVKLLNFWPSGFGMRVVIALKEKGVEYEYQEENLSNKSDLLVKSNPVHKKIPVLLHNGKAVSESVIIVQYIDEAWEGKASFLPKDPYGRAVARFWADYVDKKIYDAGSRIMRSPDGEAREQAKRDMAESFVAMDGALRDVFGGGQPFFGGRTLGLVDIALAPFICWFPAFEALGGFKLPDGQQCPHLHAWMKCVMEHPSVKEGFALSPPEKIKEYAVLKCQRYVGSS